MIRLLKDDASLAGRKAVIFDFDGTLADTMPSIVETARQVLLEFGFKEDGLGDLKRLVGPPFPQAFAQVYGVSMDEAMAITERYREIYNVKGLAAWPAFDGVAEMLHELKRRGFSLAIASSKGHWLVNKAVSDNGFATVFDAVCGKQNDMTYTKVDAINDALAALGMEPLDAVMVGDREHDAIAAAELGIPCIGVLWGHTGSAEELEAAGCVAIVDAVNEFIALLER